MGRHRKKHLGEPKVNKGRERVWWNGAWHDLGEAGSPAAKAQYKRLVALWAADPRAATPAPNRDYLVAELCTDYLASADSPQSGQPRDRVIRAAGLLLERYPETLVDDFGSADLEEWQAWLCQIPGGRNGTLFNITTVKDLVWAVRRVWKWGVRKRGVAAEKYQSLLLTEWPKYGTARDPKVVEPANPDHFKATLPHLRPPVRAMVVIQLATGARPAELCGMKSGDVQRSGQVYIPGAGVQYLDREGVWIYVLDKHKTKWKGKPRWLTFGPEVWPVLKPFLDREPGEYCFSPTESTDDMRQEMTKKRRGSGNRKKGTANPKLAPGKRYSPRTYRQAIERACVKAGVPHWNPYQLRHAAAAEIKALYDLDAVQALLGHHTKTMAEHYGGAAFKKAAEVARGR